MLFGRSCSRLGTGATLLVLTLVAGCRDTATSAFEVDRCDVTLTALADGSIDVLEAISARATRPQATFTRDVPRRKVDRILDADVGLDNKPGGEVRIDRSGGLRATWQFATAGESHVMMLRYRLAGALAARETRALMGWSALPADRPYSVSAARINIRVASGGAFVAGPAIDNARVEIAPDRSQAAAELTAVAPSQDVFVTAEVAFEAGSIPEPEWQTNATLAQRLMPAFMSAGACLLLIAGGIVVMIRLQSSQAGTIDDSRATDAAFNSVVRGLRASGWVALVVAAAGAVVIDRTLSKYGAWPMAIPIGVAGMGAVFLMVPALWLAGRRQ